MEPETAFERKYMQTTFAGLCVKIEFALDIDICGCTVELEDSKANEHPHP